MRPKLSLPEASSAACAAALGVVNRHLAVHDLLDELLRLVDAIVHPGEQHRFAVEAGGLHLLFCCHDDAVAVCDLFSGEDVLCSIRAIGLHLGGQTQLVTGLGQGLSSHIGVGNAVDAGGHGQNAVTALGDLLLGEALRAELSLLLCIDAVKELCRGLCSLQLFYKVLVHQHLHHTGQHVPHAGCRFPEPQWQTAGRWYRRPRRCTAQGCSAAAPPDWAG